MDDRQQLKFIEAYFSVGWTNRLELIFPDAPTSISLDQFIHSLPKNLINQQGHKVKLAEPYQHLNQNQQHQLSISHQQLAVASLNSSQANEKYKTTLCNSFAKFGICRYGASCLFAHGETDLRLPNGNGDVGGNRFKRRPSNDYENNESRHSTNYRTSIRKL
ncbi:C3H1-type domain-containing protein [Meloidogyne graminicola]|uniref:C3H1-type domain-containing protein n=1 Tax=Meloidogyne graminicola TaxID=189291 RepID=A0A8S9Z667_9BILA|nr:C3H1-type domain-containing protein [Meloidogyne graminicola]